MTMAAIRPASIVPMAVVPGVVVIEQFLGFLDDRAQDSRRTPSPRRRARPTPSTASRPPCARSAHRCPGAATSCGRAASARSRRSSPPAGSGRRLKQQDVVGVHQHPDRLGVADARRASARHGNCTPFGASCQPPNTISSSMNSTRRPRRRSADSAGSRCATRRSRCPASSRRTGTAPRPRRRRR